MGRVKLPQLWIECEVRDRDNKLVDRRRLRGQTWVGNIVGLLSSMLKGCTTGTYTTSLYHSTTRADMVDTGGTTRGLHMSCSHSLYYIGAEAPAGNDALGILVGASATPVALGQYNLISKITNGSGAGQLLYGATSVEDMAKGAAWSVRVVRTFSNASGAAVTVYEVGLVIRVATAHNVTANILLARDVIPDGVVVPDGGVLTVRYIISHSI